MGPPGSGKGTQARRLASRPGWLHLSTGDLFRENLRNGTSLGKLAEQHMSKGEYVPDDITVEMVRERMRQVAPSVHVVFDGFPRTVPQAEALDALLAEHGRRVARVILIDVQREELVARLAKRAEGRSDDSPAVARKRFDVYQEQTRPVIEHYDRQGLVCRIDGIGTIDDVQERIAAAVS
ncbi:MAG: adenylate kinase [Chloroflexi bacterium]|nr:adenylate kinase [Chloroflexota bacterium]MBI2983092.1 adenylate kinase [Chloroflexota bacterium]